MLRNSIRKSWSERSLQDLAAGRKPFCVVATAGNHELRDRG